MRVFSQMCFFNEFFGKLRAEKRTWAKPMSSKQWKSLYESDDSAFRVSYAFFRFLKKLKKNDTDFRGPFGGTILMKTLRRPLGWHGSSQRPFGRSDRPRARWHEAGSL